MKIDELLVVGNNFRSTKEVKFLNPLVMAFIGDSVYTTYIKSIKLDLFSCKVNVLTKETSVLVNAKFQRDSLFKIMNELTEEELDIVKRARNSNIHTKAKNYSIEEYRYATAFEALIGYLYLTKDIERLNYLLRLVFDGDDYENRR